MKFRRIGRPQWLLLVSCAALLVVGLACGGTTAPEPSTAPSQAEQSQPAASGSSAPAAPTPTFTPMPTRVLDATPTAIPVPTPVAIDERPDWWQEGEGKHYRGTFPMVGNSNPGFWDVHYGGSLNTTLMPSSPNRTSEGGRLLPLRCTPSLWSDRLNANVMPIGVSRM